jgi:hypothetical protein
MGIQGCVQGLLIQARYEPTPKTGTLHMFVKIPHKQSIWSETVVAVKEKV